MISDVLQTSNGLVAIFVMINFITIIDLPINSFLYLKKKKKKNYIGARLYFFAYGIQK